MKCQDCGTEEGVDETTCPYTQDINEEVVYIVVCDDCYSERVMAI